MKRKEVLVYDYLNDEEANEFIRVLKENNIRAIRLGMNNDGPNLYQIIIDQSDLEPASKIAQVYREKLKIERRRTQHICSRCKSLRSIVIDKEKLNWLKRLMVRGLTVIKCQKCGHVWYI